MPMCLVRSAGCDQLDRAEFSKREWRSVLEIFVLAKMFDKGVVEGSQVYNDYNLVTIVNLRNIIRSLAITCTMCYTAC